VTPFDPEILFKELPTPAAGKLSYTFEKARALKPGSQKTVVCLHGLPGSVRDFRYLGPQLSARGFNVLRFNLPGFGQTPAHIWPKHDMKHRAAFVAYALQQLRLEDTILLGHSFGGGLAMMSAHVIEEARKRGNTPTRVCGLALINSMGITRHRGLSVPESFMALVRQLLKIGPLTEPIVQKFHELYLGLGFKERDLLDAFGRFDADRVALFTELISGLQFAELRRAVKTLRAPLLMYSSKNDPYIEPKISHTLFAHFPDEVRGRHVQKKEGGHFLQKSLADEIAESCARAFFSKS